MTFLSGLSAFPITPADRDGRVDTASLRKLVARLAAAQPVSYAPLTEDEVFEHFSIVARGSSLPIGIYDNPATTHFRFRPELVGRLAKVPGIVAIKNSAGIVDERCAAWPDCARLSPMAFRSAAAATGRQPKP